MIDPSRRKILKGLFAAVSAAFAHPDRAEAGTYLDRGIGGTGATAEPKESERDRGIGGTGVIGTIRRFGSIFVNGLRISYPEDVSVSLDGTPGRLSDLELGQMVRVVALPRDGGLSTRKIEVSSEVVGRIESVSLDGFGLLGQTVSTVELPKAGSKWRIGDHVAVSGLRRLDGTIVATLVEKRPGDAERVAGPLVAGPDGSAMVGRLKLAGLDPALIGQRAILTGRMSGSVFAVSSAQSELAFLTRGVKDLSVEAYVERVGSGLRLGSGLVVSGEAGDLPRGKAVVAVINAGLERNGRLKARSIRIDRSGGVPRPGASDRRGDVNQQGGSGAPGAAGGAGDGGEAPGFTLPGGSGTPGGFDASGGIGSPTGLGAPGGLPGAGAGGFGNPGGLSGTGGGLGPGGFGPPGGAGRR
ncbi:DUF5666 domain-containing protein [Methylocapsa acidiphila]|uniref:DUF5666 domain-containing protein n=1 Tax=Methylocapsa acidiphila TaxID=133552 RepID=UPI000406A3E9|nr:DUF5666 domain-containing protein [Methylocapsa acidiphila]